MEAEMQEDIEMCIIKKELENFQLYMKVDRNVIETKKRKQKQTQKRNRKNKKHYQGNKKIMSENKD